MTRFVILLLILFSHATFAKSSIFFGIQSALNNTSLLNKEDKKVLDYLPTFRSAYGLILGYKISNNIGLRSIQLGLCLQTVSQKYKGLTPIGHLSNLSAQTDINYLHIPFELSFNIRSNKRMTPIISLGVFANKLLKYKDISKAHYDQHPTENYYYSIKNKGISNEIKQYGYEITPQ